MDRSRFDEITKYMVKDGVKISCYIVREYLRHANNGNMDNCAVTKEEYELALKRVLAFSFNNSNYYTTVNLGKCQEDCEYIDDYFCDGEFSRDDEHYDCACLRYFPAWYK